MNLIDYLPSRYGNSEEIVDIEAAIDPIMQMSEEARADLFLQFNLLTATWGLELWEAEYGIETDISKDYDIRRSKVMSKMRGVGTTTVELIKNTAESFVNGLVAVTEHNDSYYFDVEMLSVIGLPPNMDDLKKAIEEVKPAHLAYNIIIKYNTHADVSSFTHGGLEVYTHGGIREEALTVG